MDHPRSIVKRLNNVATLRNKFTTAEAMVTKEQAEYLIQVCDRLLHLSKTSKVTHSDIDITMGLLYERHEHYFELNKHKK